MVTYVVSIVQRNRENEIIFFVPPPVRLNDRTVQWVRKTKSLGITLDDKLKWKEHVEEIKLAFASKLNLLKSINFLPKHMLEDFYWKVNFPAVTYGTLVWESCGKTQ